MRFIPPAEAVPVLSTPQHGLADYDALLPGYRPIAARQPAEQVCHG